jgi:hypothetical protein
MASVTACLLAVPNFGPMCRYAFFSPAAVGYQRPFLGN